MNLTVNQLWVVQEREFYNKPMPEWLEDNYILPYSTHNEGKMVGRSIKTLQAKIYKKK